MTVPTVHSNGTSRESLIGGYIFALEALRAALSALDTIAPNGRDYYTQGPDAWTAAHREHVARVAALSVVRAEIEQIAETVAG